MSRLGRNLEKIVRDLEKLLGDSNLEVKSPDKLFDYASEIYREVDISIKGKLGTNPILIVIECRDWGRAQNVTWIEQLKTKRDGIRANKMIAVSTSGFSPNAVILAEKYGIGIRNVNDLDAKELSGWIANNEVVDIFIGFEVEKVDYVVTDSSELGDVAPKATLPTFGEREMNKRGTNNALDKVFILKNTGQRFSINDLVSRLISKIKFQGNTPLLDKVKPNQEPIEATLPISFSDSSTILLVECDTTIYRIVEMNIRVKLWKTERSIPISSIMQYTSPEEILAERVDFTFTDENEKAITVSIQRDKQTGKGNVLFDYIKEDKGFSKI